MSRNLARILIVDDEPNVRLVFQATLEATGYQVMTAEGGREALTILGEPGKAFDLLLLDLKMPEVDGLATLRRLRALNHGLPVIILTAHGTVPDAVKAMRLGAIDVLAKPLSPAALREVVAEVLARHAPEAQEPALNGVVTAASEFARALAMAKRALNRREFDEAEVGLKEAIALEPRSAEAHNLMGVVCELRGDHDSAYRCYKAALKADRHHGPAERNMRRYYEMFTFGHSATTLDAGELEG